jgi:hypothetical protein
MISDPYVDAVLGKSEAMKKAGLWLPENVRPRAWLENFEEADQMAAAAILDNLLYLSDRMTNALLRATYRNLADELWRSALPGGRPGDLDAAIFTRVDGEQPNISDSGNLFSRKVRNQLNVPEERLAEPAVALEAAVTESRPVVFLDDFMGSSYQLQKTWRNSYREDHPRSFAEAQKCRPFPAYYIVLVTTSQGLELARYRCAGLHVVPGHVLGEEYSVRRLADQPNRPNLSDLPDRIHRLLAKYSDRLALDLTMRQSDFALYGFHSFGLTVAFQHGIPDASIPLIWAKGSGSWTRLVSPA